jgi:hypothetical protein
VVVTLGVGEPDLANWALANSATLTPVVATHRSPEGSKAMPPGMTEALVEMVTVGAGEALVTSALLYSTTVRLPWFATQRSPEESKMSPMGALTPEVTRSAGCALPVGLGR